MEDTLKEIFRLDKMVVVITGAAGLLGAKHAEAIAAYGGIPVLLDVDKSGMEHISKTVFDKFKVKAECFQVDITDEAQVKECAWDVMKKMGRLDGLVNNAANNPKVENNEEGEFSRLENFPFENWQRDIAIGLTGAFLCAKYFGTKIAVGKKGGAIINISSDLGLIAPDQRIYRRSQNEDQQQSVKPVSYSVIKTGLIGLTRYLATYWPDKVRCNVLCPGGVETTQDEEFLVEVRARIPQGRLATPNEYQGALVFLLSRASSYMNGSIISMDGGRSTW